MPTSLTRFAALPLLVLALLTPASVAQDLSPNTILDASRQALNEIPGLSAQFKMQGESGSMFADTMPSMSGQLFFGTHSKLGKVIHAIGEAKDQKSSPSKGFDVLIASDRLIWTDRSTQTVTEVPNQPNMRGVPSSIGLILVSSILADDPYARDANNAQSIELVGQEEINGVVCDQIVIKRADKGKRNARDTSDAYTDVVWWIGVDDKLPRKVTQITDAGLVKINLTFEMSKLKVIEPSDEQLDVARPEGFTFTSKLAKPAPEPEDNNDQIEPQQPDQSPDPTDTPPAAPKAPAGPRVDFAPSYRFTPEGATEVTNATQAGRVTVLYFWGSWCVPCADASTLVSSITTDFADRDVDVFGIAVREANPSQVSNEFRNSALAFSLVMNPSDLASDFKVRVYPSIVVINTRAEIAYRQGISRDRDADALAREARDAIEKALAKN